MRNSSPFHQTFVGEAQSLTFRDAVTKSAAQNGCFRLLSALLSYGARHGLPNIDASDCGVRLKEMQKRERTPREEEWPADRVEMARILRAEGRSYGQIAMVVHRSADAVAAKLRALG